MYISKETELIVRLLQLPGLEVVVLKLWLIVW